MAGIAIITEACIELEDRAYNSADPKRGTTSGPSPSPE